MKYKIIIIVCVFIIFLCLITNYAVELFYHNASNSPKKGIWEKLDLTIHCQSNYLFVDRDTCYVVNDTGSRVTTLEMLEIENNYEDDVMNDFCYYSDGKYIKPCIMP